jgi:predicted nucleotidyltransferase
MSTLLNTLTEYLQNHKQVSAAWIFGSVATGKNRADSDIDLAILFVQNLSKEKRFDLLLSLAVDLSKIAACEVDLVDIQTAPLFLQYEIRKNGHLLFEKDHIYRVNHDVQSRREYLDLAAMLELRNKSLIEKAIGGK